MKRYLNILFLLCLIVNCSIGDKGINCIVLFDYSASLPDTEFDKYVHMFRYGLLKQMTFDDQMILIPIDKASEMKNEVIAECRFRELKDQLAQNIPSFQILSESDTVNVRFKRMLDTLFHKQIYYFKNQRKRFNTETDIVGALNQSTNYTNYSKNAIFIFSDMIQESPEVNLKKLKSTSAIDKKITELINTAQLPDLKNSYIFVCGATAKKKKDYRLNKYFWTIFFEKSNGMLRDYGYGNANRIANFLETMKLGG